MSNPNSRTRELTHALTSGRAKLWVLLVGVNQYQDQQFPALHYSAADCQGLKAALTAASYEFPKKHILTRHDFAANPSTLAVVRADLAQIVAEAKPQDTVLFYFSGHGMLASPSQQAVLCLRDTSHTALLETGLRIHELMHSLSTCEARQQIVWLDACHSGELIMPGAKGSRVALSTEPTAQIVDALRLRAAQSRGFYAMLSCDQGQRSWEFPELGHGLFTYYLIRGLQGEAADAEGVIGVDGLYRYVYQQTIEFIDQKNQQVRTLNQQKRQNGEYLLHSEYPPQTPKRIVDGVGELVLGLKPDKVMAHFRQSSPSAPSSGPDSVPSGQVPNAAAPPAANSAAVSPPTRRQRPILALAGVAMLMLGVGLLLALRSIQDQALPDRLTGAAGNQTVPTTDADACNIQVNQGQVPPETTPASLDAQVVLSPCPSDNPWRRVQAQSLAAGKPAWEAIFAPNGTLVTAGGRVSEIWNLETQQPTHTLGGHTDWVYAVAISPDGKTLASASADRTIRVWDAATGTLLRILSGHEAAIWSVAISPDGNTLASASADQTIKLWDLKTGELQRTLEGHTNWVFAVGFSPTQPLLASASQDRTIKLWNAETGALLQTLTGHDDTVRAIAFAPEGQTLASASWDKTVKLWQIPSGELLQTFTGHRDRVLSVAFDVDGQTLASGSRDQLVKLWDVNRPDAIGTFYGHTDWVLSVAFSPDGKTLASGSRDQTIMLWRQ